MPEQDQQPLPPQAEVATPPPPPPPPQQQQQESTHQQQQSHLQPHPHPYQDTDDMTIPPPPPPPLEPFFTLVTNTTTATTIHPRVQYLFSDDDLSALVANQPSSSPSSPRPLVVDLVPTPDNASWSVSWASSLSPDFALTSSCITVQPDSSGSNDNDNDIHKETSATLRLEGVERDPPDASRPAGTGTGSLPSSDSATALGQEDVDALADEFRRRMVILRKVVGESEKRRLVTDEPDPCAQVHSSPSPSLHGHEQDQVHCPEATPDDEADSPGAEAENPARRIPTPEEHTEAVGLT
ncbi:hypothetical protein E4U42_007942 [Claviceps africana]|uniref:Uncharacterized protein n=1 Tax=Claviceps africana TaxID=83212 RepID=A0A8K0NJX1_9HYPO|nr:hypothetical protein E4U42_007942 [Claviceps africana]